VRVAIITECFEHGTGGARSVAWHLARELGRRGVDISVVHRTTAGPIPDGVDLIRARAWGASRRGRLAGFSRGAARLTRDLFDVVHAFSPTKHQSIYRPLGGGHAEWMERVCTHPRRRRWLSRRHRALLRRERAIFRDPGQLIECDSYAAARAIAEGHGVPASRLCVTYGGVDVERFHPARREERREAARQALGLCGPTALFVGTGWEHQGLDRAIESGDPRRYRSLAEGLGVAPRIHFLGFRNRVEEVHDAADLFVLPARYAPFSHACLEAMASGLPVATMRANGVAELIRQGESGLVFDDSFETAFHLLEEPHRLERMGAAARRTAEEHSWAQHADRVMALYSRAFR
jgi:glycosyltransferase involved in cell wall biosynthesis